MLVRTIRILLLLLAVLLLNVVFAGAQATPEPNEGVHFETGISYLKLSDGANATVPWARLALSDRWSAVYSQYQIPAAKGQLFLGEAEFREKLSHLFKKKGSSQVNLDNIQVFVRGGLGTFRDDVANHPALAYGFHGGASYRVGKLSGADMLIEFKVGLSGHLGTKVVKPGVFSYQSSPEIAPGIVFRF